MDSSQDKPDPKKVAQALKNGAKISESLREGGYAASVARKGRKALTPPIIEALLQEGMELAQIGARLDKTHVEHVIAGTLYTNMLTGESKGNEAAKMLGSMVKYEAFKNDSNTNMIILQDLRQDQIAPEHALSQPPATLNCVDAE